MLNGSASPAAVEVEERKAIKAYCEEHRVDELVRDLVVGLLRDRPETKPKEHFAHMLRMRLLKEQQGDRVTDLEIDEASKASEVPGRLLVNLFQATKNITAEIVPKETINIIFQETLKLLHCDRVSLVIYDKRINMLVLNASNLENPIRVKPGQGISDHVLETQEPVNIANCYEDERFDPTFDKQTGYRTNNILMMPIVDFEGECMGALQAMNKLEGTCFSHIDEILLENLTQHVGIALRNAEIYRAAIVTSERASALLHLMQSLSQDLGAQSMILRVTMSAHELVQADRCTVFLVDEKKQQLWSVSTDSMNEIRIPKTAGIAGECATEAKLIVIPDAYEDPRFNQDVDRKTGYRTKSILAVPVLRRQAVVGVPRTFAVIQMINKTEFDGEIGKFDDEDIQVMETFATFVSAKLEHSTLLTTTEPNKSEAGKAFASPKATRRPSRRQSEGSAIAESLEEHEVEDPISQRNPSVRLSRIVSETHADAIAELAEEDEDEG